MANDIPEPSRPQWPSVPAETRRGASGASGASAAAGTVGDPGVGLDAGVEPTAGTATDADIDVGHASGRTRIADVVVAKVAAVAARSVTGVNTLGTGSARALGAIRGAVGGENLAQGVAVEVGEAQVAVDINFIADYGHPLQSVANQVRAAVYAAVEKLVGLQVIEVNIEINDVHIPGAGAAKDTRTQEKKEPRD